MHDRRGPGSVEGRPLNAELWGRLVEVRVTAGADEAVVACHSSLEGFGWHRSPLMGHHDVRGQLAQRVGLEEEAGFSVYPRRGTVPTLAGCGIGVEDRPDGATAVVAVGEASQRGVEKVSGVVVTWRGAASGVWDVILDRAVVIVRVAGRCFVVKARAEHVHQNYVLPVFYP